MTLNDQEAQSLEVESIHRDARGVYLTKLMDLSRELMSYADTTLNRQILIRDAFNTASETYKFYGFCQAVTKFSVLNGEVPLVAAVEMESKYEKESRTNALGLIKVLREDGFTTADINEFSPDLKGVFEAARVLGQAEALVHLTRPVE